MDALKWRGELTGSHRGLQRLQGEAVGGDEVVAANPSMGKRLGTERNDTKCGKVLRVRMGWCAVR
jgi:hypothetical protein